MGLLDVFKRTRSSVVLGPRSFYLVIAGHGIETRPRLPIAAAHLVDGTLVFGPYDLAAARAQNLVRNVLIRPGAPPTGALQRHSMSESSIVTYSTAERGTTQLVLGTGMRDHHEVLDAISVAAQPPLWRIVTDQIDCWWPTGFSLRASGDMADERGPFHLAHEGSTIDLIQFFGPLVGDQIPAPEQLTSRLASSANFSNGGTRIDAGQLDGAVRPIKHYTFESDASAQRYYYVHLDAAAIYLVRARATIDKAAFVFKAADTVCASLKPRF